MQTVVERLVVTDTASRTASKSRRLIVFFCLLAVMLGGIEAWLSRNDMYSDGVSYMDIGDAFVQGQWNQVVNAYWSPLYPALLGAAAAVLKPSAGWQFATVHLVNFLLYLVALACFHGFLVALVRYKRDRRADHSYTWWIPVGYALFLWTTLRLISVSVVSPDMAVAASVYGAAAALLRIKTDRAQFQHFAWLGLALGLGYLAKAPMFPMSIVFLGLSWFAAKNSRKALGGVLIAMAVFGAIAGPYIAALSHQQGHLTFGESAKLNYGWYVNHLPRYHWQGEQLGSGTPGHPERRIFDSPPVYTFEQPINGTYPIWKDPAYWFTGVRTHIDLKGNILQAVENSDVYYDVLFRSQPLFALVFLTLLLWSGSAREFPRRLLREWILWIPPLCALSMFALVHVETRMIGAYVVILWLGLFAGLALPHGRVVGSMASALAGIVIVALCVSDLGDMKTHGIAFLLRGDNSSSPPHQIAAGLGRLGIHPGDRVAWIRPQPFDAKQNYYWARIADVHITAEIPVGEGDKFWSAPEPVKEQALQAMARTGVRALIATAVPAGAVTEEWRPMGKTGYFTLMLDSRAQISSK
jgi:hypothetical protein